MYLNHTETITNSSSSVLRCPHLPNFRWDTNASTFYWFIDAIVLIASPCTILLNAMVIIVMKQSKELQRPSTILLSSLAVTDLLIGCIVMPLSVTIDALILRQVSSEHICMLDMVNSFFMASLFSATLNHLTIIAWERYVAIQKWMDYKVIITNSRVKSLATAAWLSALLPAVTIIMTVVGVDHRITGACFTVSAVGATACLTVSSLFYLKVYLGIRNRKINDFRQVTVLVKAKLESKVAKTTGLLTCALLFSFIPICVAHLLGSTFPVFRSSVVFRFTETVTQLNSLCSPLLYWYRDRCFRKAIREVLGRSKNTQETQPAVGVVRFVRQKNTFDAEELHNVEKPTRRLTRSASCHPPDVFDCDHGRPRDEVMLKRSLSVPTLNKCSSCFDGLDRQQPSSIITISTAIYAESSM